MSSRKLLILLTWLATLATGASISGWACALGPNGLYIDLPNLNWCPVSDDDDCDDYCGDDDDCEDWCEDVCDD